MAMRASYAAYGSFKLIRSAGTLLSLLLRKTMVLDPPLTLFAAPALTHSAGAAAPHPNPLPAKWRGEGIVRVIPACWGRAILGVSCCSEGCRSGGVLIGGGRMQVGGAVTRRTIPRLAAPAWVKLLGQRLLNAAGRPQILLEQRRKGSFPHSLPQRLTRCSSPRF